jgi:hypothetical protein
VSHVTRLLLLSCFACAFACTVPTLEELEAERPAGCDENHKCPSDAVCFENRCIRTEGLACTPGAREACGAEQGECRPGTRLCGATGVFGACEGEVAPVTEVCDGRDNNCDGQVDDWNAVPFTKNHDLGTFLAAVPVSRSSVGKADTVLVVTTEDSGKLVTRAYTTDGTLSTGETLAPPGTNSKYLYPALAEAGDTVAMAWIEETYLQSTGRRLYKVSLALLDGSGKLTTPVIDIPYGSTLPEVTGVKLALDSTHVLVLVSTVGTASGPTAPTPRELWAITASRNLADKVLSTPLLLGAPAAGFGLHATANGTANQFLVAFESNHVRQTRVLSNAGQFVGDPLTITQNAFNHSPFIVPTQGSASDHAVYFVQNSLEDRTDLVSWTCSDGRCGLLKTLTTWPHKIERMQMAARPGEPMPGLALWGWKDAAMERSALSVAAITAQGVGEVASLRPSSFPTFSEVLVLMPDSSRHVAFHQYPPTAQGLGIVTQSEAYLRSFCGP